MKLPWAHYYTYEEELKEVVDTTGSRWVNKYPKATKFEAVAQKFIGSKHSLF